MLSLLKNCDMFKCDFRKSACGAAEPLSDLHPPSPTCPRAHEIIQVVPVGFIEHQRRVISWLSVCHGLCRMEWGIGVLRDCKIVDTFRRNYARHTPLSEMLVKFTWLRSLHIFLLQVVSCHTANKSCRPILC